MQKGSLSCAGDDLTGRNLSIAINISNFDSKIVLQELFPFKECKKVPIYRKFTDNNTLILVAIQFEKSRKHF
jgi:hypothetical protein